MSKSIALATALCNALATLDPESPEFSALYTASQRHGTTDLQNLGPLLLQAIFNGTTDTGDNDNPFMGPCD